MSAVFIEQHGDMRYMGAWWWKRFLDAMNPPAEISELWDGMFDWLDDYEQGWAFEKLNPATATHQTNDSSGPAIASATDLENPF